SFGLGYVVTKTHWVLDIDNCFNDATKTWSSLAIELCNSFKGCAIEISVSGKGLHIYGVGTPPPHTNRNSSLGIEFYTENRFVALTGTNATGDADFDATEILKEIIP